MVIGSGILETERVWRGCRYRYCQSLWFNQRRECLGGLKNKITKEVTEMRGQSIGWIMSKVIETTKIYDKNSVGGSEEQ